MARTTASVAEAFRTTLDLFETGLMLMSQNLKRAEPLASEEEVDRRLRDWLHKRPGAEIGDCGGSVVDVTGGRR